MMIKKALTFILSATLITCILFSLPTNVSAANAESKAGVVSTAWGSLNVRSSNSTTSAILTALPKGSSITLLSKNGSWWSIEYASGKYGYCYANYIQPVSGSFAAYVNTVSSGLNVRSGAGTSYNIQTSLAKGTGFVVLSQSGNWSRILYNGTKIGYVSSSYVKAYASTETYPAIQLYVPSYKQTDSRWSNYPIGTNGKTISTVGCLTTALAMTESYQTGTTIYPNTMASRLNYTSDGTLYWPSNYVFYVNNYYLQVLYTKLKNGKPVILGAKNSYGRQHWVVVTGYTGGNILSASNFKINDPGSKYRTTLQHLFNAYPYFHRVAYYK